MNGASNSEDSTLSGGEADLLARDARRATEGPAPAHLARQERIRTEPNPNPKVDYLVCLEGRVGSPPEAPVRVGLCYVPGKLILAPSDFQAYLDALPDPSDTPLETLGQMVMDDLNNAVVTRWIQIVLRVGETGPGGHTVLLEDRQPRWDNPPLLARVPPL